MPILDIQKRARELGRIRIGQKGAKGQPQKLDRFRLTSSSKTLLDKVAELYGGTVKEWTPAGGAAQWEVITDSKRLPIMVPPQPVSQWLETWSAGGCIHRCDGVTNVLTDEPCDLESREHREAKPTTRLNVVLRDVEGIGVWRLESHGWNAAVELPDAATFLAQVGGYVNGWVALEERVSKSDGQTRKFMVPIIEIDVTPAELMAGRGRVETPSIEGPVQQAAPAALPSTPAPDYEALARAASDLDSWRDVWNQAKDAGHLTDALKATLTPIGQALSPTPPPAAQPVDDVHEAEVVEDETPQKKDLPTDPDTLWNLIVTEAGNRGMTLDQLEQDFAWQNGGTTPDSASAGELSTYLEALSNAPQPVNA